MKLKEIELINFRGIDRLTIPFEDNVNLFVGINGSGKSTILDGIAISLSWLINGIQRENSPGNPIPRSSVKNETDFSALTATFIENDREYTWKVVETQTGVLSDEKSELSEVSALAAYYMGIRKTDNRLPVVVYYPVNRLVGTVNPQISGRENLSMFDVYDNALGGQTNYQAFFEWFRLKEDIINERAFSRTRWIASNRDWVEKRVDALLYYFDLLIPENGKGVEERYLRRRLNKRNRILFEDPGFLLMELNQIIYTEYTERAEQRNEFAYGKFRRILHSLYELSSLHSDDLIEYDVYLSGEVERVVDVLINSEQAPEPSDKELLEIKFIWEALLFSVLLSLWWMSEKGKTAIEALFRTYSPGEQTYLQLKEGKTAFIDEFDSLIKNDVELLDNDTGNQSLELQWVTYAIEHFVDGYSNLRVKRFPRPHFLVDKAGKTLNMDQLSDGEKNMIALVGDIARRLAMANPSSKEPLKGGGIVLIDEIDLHLHPAWQRLIIPKLTELFPGCQFIITTHSPQVISHVPRNSVFILQTGESGMELSKAEDSFGMNTDRILEDLMSVDARPTKEKLLLEKTYQLIQEGKTDEATGVINELFSSIGDDPELLKARTLIKRKQLIGK